jgi:hypothetical protein
MSDHFASNLATRLANDLETRFPGWLISMDTWGQWSAVRPGWGVLYGRTAAELRERLEQYAALAAAACAPSVTASWRIEEG